MKHFEHTKRSLVKTITYRILIVISTATFVYLLTGQIQKTIDITIITNIASTVIYYIHERIWNRIHWGKGKNTSKV